MSALQFLREKAGILVAVVIGISLLLFVVSDFFGNGRGQRQQQRKYYEIGEIAGEVVSYQDYELRLKSLLEIYKLSGRSDIDEATTESIREQTWQQMVREKILDSQYEKLGVGVSSEELDGLVFGNNPHQIVQQLFTDQTTGFFNQSFLVNFLKQTEVDETAKKYWLFFENEIVNDRMNTKYNNLVAKGLYVTSKQAEYDRNLTANTVDFSYILKNYASIPDTSVTISDSDIQSYYSKHKNNYKRTSLRDIEYVIFDIIPSEDDVKKTEEWVENAKEEFAEAADPVQFINLTADSRHISFYSPLSDIPDNLQEFARKENTNTVFGPYLEDDTYKIARLIDVANRPDSVHARHILLSPNQAASLEMVKQQADSLVKLIKSGTTFESLALTLSDDEGSAQIGGDLGWFPEGRMVVPFNNACFTAKKGELKIVETAFGVHIIELIEKSRDTKKYNIGIVDRKILAGSITNQKAYSEASQFAGTNDTYEKFLQAIAEEGMNKRIANDIPPQQKALPGLENPRSLIISLYQTREGEIILDNSEQAVFEVGDSYVIAYCTKIQEDGIAPVKAVENDIRFALIKEKKAELISKEFISNNAEGSTIDNIANAMGLAVQEATQVTFRSYTVPGNAGSEPALIGAASVAKEGVIEGPVKGVNGVYMLVANNLVASNEDNINMLQERLKINFQMRGNYEAYEAIRKDAKILDKRYKFY